MRLGIIIGVVLGIIIFVAAVFAVVILGILPVSRQTSDNPVNSPLVTFSAPTVFSSPASPRPSTPVAPRTSPASPSPSSTSAPNVDFEIKVTGVVISGLTSAEISADLTNTGKDHAYNTRARLEVFFQGTRIPVNGQEYLLINLGTVLGGETKSSRVRLDFELKDALKVSQNGAKFVLTVTSDQKTETISYDYRP